MNLHEELIRRVGGKEYVLSLQDNQLIPFYVSKGFYGYKIKSSNDVVIPAQFERAGNFEDGIAVVKKRGKYGSINKVGEVVVEFIYDHFSTFDGGVARVMVDGKWGLINKRGRMLSLMYDKLEDFNNYMLAFVRKEDKWGAIDKTGREIVPCKFDRLWDINEGMVQVSSRKKFGFINVFTGAFIDCKYDNATPYSEGLALVQVDGFYLYINKQGEIVVFPTKAYKKLYPFKSGRALVCNEIDRYGFIDLSGNEVVHCQYKGASSFCNERACVCIEEKYGYIDRMGSLVVPAKYDDAHDFNKAGIAIVTITKKFSGDKVNYKINSDGKILGEYSREKGAVTLFIEDTYRFIKNAWPGILQILKILTGRF